MRFACDSKGCRDSRHPSLTAHPLARSASEVKGFDRDSKGVGIHDTLHKPRTLWHVLPQRQMASTRKGVGIPDTLHKPHTLWHVLLQRSRASTAIREGAVVMSPQVSLQGCTTRGPRARRLSNYLSFSCLVLTAFDFCSFLFFTVASHRMRL